MKIRIIYILIAAVTTIGCSEKSKRNNTNENEIILLERYEGVENIIENTFDAKLINGIVKPGELAKGNREAIEYNIMEFDNSGNLITGVTNHSTGNYFFKDEFIYDRNNILLSKQRFFRDGVTNKQIWRYIYKKDTIEIIGTQKPVFGSGSEYPYNKFLLLLNDNNQIIKELEYTNNLPSRVGYSKKASNEKHFKYDSIGNLIEETHFLNDEVILTKLMSYNKKNLLLKLEISGYSNEIISFKYKYDENENWIEKIDYVDNIPVFITTRKFKYKK